jgi:hypothetical protein
MDAWNHVNFCVPPAHVEPLCAAIEALFPWTSIVRRRGIIGYRLGDDLNRGALYLRPTAAAAALFDAVARARASDPSVACAFADLEAQDADVTDHQGIRLPTVADWEARVARAHELARERPELRVSVIRVERPGEPGAVTDYLYQAWIRLALLGPLRNTLELQALDPTKSPVR